MSTSTVSETDKIILQLELTKKEVEQFIHELDLENIDPEVRYGKLKEELKQNIIEIRKSIEEGIITGMWTATLAAKLTQIQDHLQDPSKNTFEHIKTFLRTLKTIINKVAEALPKDGQVDEFLETLHHRLQRQRLKFEILKLRMALGKLKWAYAGEEIKHQLTHKIEALSQFISDSKYEAEEKLFKARHTVKRIYLDIHKLFSR